jgi:hypothetical protein
MTATFRVDLSPDTIIGPDFVLDALASKRMPAGRLVMEQTFVHSGALNTLVGELVGDRIERPVLGSGS